MKTTNPIRKMFEGRSGAYVVPGYRTFCLIRSGKTWTASAFDRIGKGPTRREAIANAHANFRKYGAL